MTKDAEFANILYKLRWSAERGEWSAHLTPAECGLVLDRLRPFQAYTTSGSMATRDRGYQWLTK